MRLNQVFRIVLLSMVGGSADAIAYVRYGVFVGAMTGNTVLIGIDLIGENFGKAAYHSAIVALFLLACVFSAAAKVSRIPRWLLLAGVAILLGASELITDKWSAAMSAAALAIQNTVVRESGIFAINTVFVTGNLARMGADVTRLPIKSGEAGLLFVALASYALGAIVGAAAEKLLPQAMWVPGAICFVSAMLP